MRGEILSIYLLIIALSQVICLIGLSQTTNTLRADSSIFFDNFENYTPGGFVAQQNPFCWTTWSNSPGSAEDAEISSNLAYSGQSSVLIQNEDDLVHPISNYQEGKYLVQFHMYIPSGHTAYYNALQQFSPGEIFWGMQIHFGDNGEASIDGGGDNSAYFNYPYDTWFMNQLIVDLNEDFAVYQLDSSIIHLWQWSTGVFGENDLNQLGGVNFYPSTASGSGTPMYYFDDFLLYQLDANPCFDPPQDLIYSLEPQNQVLLTWEPPTCPGLTGYNIYLDWELIAFINETEYLIEVNPGTIEICVTSVYGNEESLCALITIVISDLDQNNKFPTTIFPNPMTDELCIKSGKPLKTLYLIDLTGKALHKDSQINSQQYSFTRSGLQRGSYLLKLVFENSIEIEKIIVE